MHEQDEIFAETVRQWRRGWWGGHWEPPRPLSVIELMEAGSLDARLLALIWLCMEAHASVLVAAEPPEAGKTTTLTALLEFLPRQVTRVYTKGFAETFAFTRHSEPEQIWILCNEISPDLPVYTWGPAVPALFAALEKGYATATTMHADTLDAIVGVLTGYPLEVPRRQVGHLSLVLTLRLRYSGGDVLRRVGAVHLLEPAPGGMNGFTQVQVALYDAGADRLMHTSRPALEFLARRTGKPVEGLAAELDRRAVFLADLHRRGIFDVGEVRRALSTYLLSDQGAE